VTDGAAIVNCNVAASSIAANSLRCAPDPTALFVEEARRNLAVLRPEHLNHLGQLSGKREIVLATLTAIPPEAKRLPDKDLPVLLAAVPGGASHFLTVDKKHLGPLFGKTVGNLLILSPGEYLMRRPR